MKEPRVIVATVRGSEPFRQQLKRAVKRRQAMTKQYVSLNSFAVDAIQAAIAAELGEQPPEAPHEASLPKKATAQ